MEKWKDHKCEYLPVMGVRITGECDDSNEWFWQLKLFREATEEDLEENNVLEELGEILWTTTVDIVFCPYCGERLTQESQSADPEFGVPECIDSSAWHTRVL